MAAGLTAVSCGDGPHVGAASSSASASAAALLTEPLRVAAASDLARAFEEVGAAYQKETGNQVVFSFGSTGLFAKQLHEGAPFDVFAAANVKFVDDVVRDGRCRAETKTLYARGRIVLFARAGADVPAKVEDLIDPRFRKIAIANPEHAPYGAAAKQALERAGVYDRVKDRLVFGENILQTKQFADSGNADVAIVALSLAIGGAGPYAEIPADRHDPLDQALVVCAPDARLPAARAFVEWVGREEGRIIMRKYGFLLPSESLTPTVLREEGARASGSEMPDRGKNDRGWKAHGPERRVTFAPLFLSLEVATIATIVATVLGVAVGATLATRRFWGRDAVDVLLTTPMILPPTVLGYYVLTALGRTSVIGRAYEAVVGDTIVFTKVGAVIAATIGALPLVAKAARSAVEGVDPALVAAARTLGATPWRAFSTIVLPLASRGILGGVMLGFARALGDFGVTLMIAGDIPGVTRTASLAIYGAIQAGRDTEAAGMVAVLTAISVVVLYAVGKLGVRRDA